MQKVYIFFRFYVGARKFVAPVPKSLFHWDNCPTLPVVKRGSAYTQSKGIFVTVSSGTYANWVAHVHLSDQSIPQKTNFMGA